MTGMRMCRLHDEGNWTIADDARYCDADRRRLATVRVTLTADFARTSNRMVAMARAVDRRCPYPVRWRHRAGHPASSRSRTTDLTSSKILLPTGLGPVLAVSAGCLRASGPAASGRAGDSTTVTFRDIGGLETCLKSPALGSLRGAGDAPAGEGPMP